MIIIIEKITCQQNRENTNCLHREVASTWCKSCMQYASDRNYRYTFIGENLVRRYITMRLIACNAAIIYTIVIVIANTNLVPRTLGVWWGGRRESPGQGRSCDYKYSNICEYFVTWFYLSYACINYVLPKLCIRIAK